MSREAKGKGKLMSPFQTWDKKKCWLYQSFISGLLSCVNHLHGFTHTVPDGDLRERVCAIFANIQYALVAVLLLAQVKCKHTYGMFSSLYSLRALCVCVCVSFFIRKKSRHIKMALFIA